MAALSLPGGISYGYNDRSRKENTEPPQQVKTAKYFQEALVGCQEREDHLDRCCEPIDIEVKVLIREKGRT